MEHYKLFTRKQDSNESFDKFYAHLRNLVKICDFKTAEDQLLRTQILLFLVYMIKNYNPNCCMTISLLIK